MNPESKIEIQHVTDGEILSSKEIDLANKLMKDVELYIILGSSLTVSPANERPFRVCHETYKNCHQKSVFATKLK